MFKRAKTPIFISFIAVNFKGLFVTRKYAKGTTTKVSKVIVQTNNLKNKGFLNPKKIEISLLKNNAKSKKTKVEINKLINDVETTFPFSFSFEKKRKKAVSIPKVNNAFKYAA